MGSKSKRDKKASNKNQDATMAAEPTRNRVFGGGNKAITDERFQESQKDPRFQDLSKRKTKVPIDSRFGRMFTDKNFSTSSARVDKRGRAKQDGDSSETALKRFYRIDNEEQKQKKHREESDDDDDVESEEDNEENESADAEKLKKARSKLSKSKLDPESETESEFSGEEEEEEGGEEGEEDSDVSTASDTDEDVEAYLEDETTAKVEENIPEIDKETHRLAIVNLDWNQIRAVDLYVLLKSFLPKTGQILSVTVYPSKFGLEQMEKEAVHGPVGLFDDENEDDDSDNSDDDTEIDQAKLREYELNRLKYYFAVVVFDSVATADFIYNNCDGIEFERSSNKLDLRFIPDSEEFKNPPRDVATEIPANYEGVDFQTRALQQSKIDLTWDENEPQRAKKFKRKINTHKESEYVKDEEQLKEFIASSDSESDSDENDNKNPKKRQKTETEKYRALLQSGDNSDSDSGDETGMDMEVTFNTDLEDISKKILEKKDKKEETVWEAHLRKKKEKKKARKSKKDSDESDSDSDSDRVKEFGDFFDSEKKGKKVKKTDDDDDDDGDRASRAELELLFDENGDGNDNVKGYNLKRKKSKGKKGIKEGMDEEKIPSVDYDDPRFSSLFTRHDYALDPTDPQFKRSAAYVRQLAHKERKGDVDKLGGQSEKSRDLEVDNDEMEVKKDKNEMSMLLKSVKMKSKQLQADGKKSKRKGK